MGQMEHPRFWARRTRALIILASIGIATGAWLLAEAFARRSFMDGVVKDAPALAVAVALISFVATAFNLAASWTRTRREATIKVWTEWSDSHYKDRRKVTMVFGEVAMTEAQGQALVNGGILHDAYGVALTDRQKAEAANALVSMLNGLERIAVGVELGVYDLATLSNLGGTIFARTFERARPYIHARREASEITKRQSLAYVSLQNISALLERKRLVHDRREIDRNRLAALQRRR